MRTILVLLPFVLLAAGCQSVPDNALPASAPAKSYAGGDKTLYETFSTDSTTLYAQIGGRATIERIMKDAVVAFHNDQRISRRFALTNLDNLAYQLTEQVCQLSGGPCKYAGRSMAEAHKGMDLSEADFIALVEDFQNAVRKNGLPYTQENKLVALLAPMKPQVEHK